MADSRDGTRWLTGAEQQTWRSYLRATTLLHSVIESQLQDEAQIPHTYYEILVGLSEAAGRALRMSELAARSQSSRSRLSHAVSRLAELGWVRRRDCETDKRGQLAQLTDAGFAALEAAAPGHVTRVRSALFDALTPTQVEQLREICDAITTHLDQERDG